MHLQVIKIYKNKYIQNQLKQNTINAHPENENVNN